VISADDSSVVRVWDVNTGKAIYRFTDAHINSKGEPVKVSSMTFDKSSRRLLTGAHDGTIKVRTNQHLIVLCLDVLSQISQMASLPHATYT
jgi:WD40 repeat protein